MKKQREKIEEKMNDIHTEKQTFELALGIGN